MHRPKASEYDPYYKNYISLVENEDILNCLENQAGELSSLLSSFSEDRGQFAYEAGKWTIKELLSHVIDGERMFAYRLLRISRGDKTPIEGFEQDGYIENSHANRRSFSELLKEFELVRTANMILFRNLDETDLTRTGTANNVRQRMAERIPRQLNGRIRCPPK